MLVCQGVLALGFVGESDVLNLRNPLWKCKSQFYNISSNTKSFVGPLLGAKLLEDVMHIPPSELGVWKGTAKTRRLLSCFFGCDRISADMGWDVVKPAVGSQRTAFQATIWAAYPLDRLGCVRSWLNGEPPLWFLPCNLLLQQTQRLTAGQTKRRGTLTIPNLAT